MNDINFILKLSSIDTKKIKNLVKYLRSENIDFSYVDSHYGFDEMIEDDKSNIVIKDNTVDKNCFYSSDDQEEIHRKYVVNQIMSNLEKIGYISSEYTTTHNDSRVIYISKHLSDKARYMFEDYDTLTVKTQKDKPITIIRYKY